MFAQRAVELPKSLVVPEGRTFPATVSPVRVPTEGDEYYDTTEDKLKVYNGTAWE